MKNKNLTILLLNLIWLAIYFIVFFSINNKVSSDVIFSSPDAKEYLATSKEFFNFSETGFSLTRPFLFPLILGITYKIFGAYGFWLLQFIFWIVSINLLYFSIKQICGKTILAIAGSLLLACNLSHIALTLHGVTEVITIFLLTVILFILTFHIAKVQTLKIFHRCLFFLVLLTVIKPLFYFPLIFVLLVILSVFYGKKYFQQPRQILLLLLIITPLLLQITVMKIKYDTFSVSRISSITLKNYLLTQGIQKINNISYEEAKTIAKCYNAPDAFHYILENKKIFAGIFRQNIIDNIKAPALFLTFPAKNTVSKFSRFMIKMDGVFYYVHLVFIPIMFIFLIVFIRKKEWESLIILVLLTGLNYYILISSGISFWQGDRLVLPALPVFITLYLFVIGKMIDKTRRALTLRKQIPAH